MKEIHYRNDYGSVSTKCPFSEKVQLYNSLHSATPSGERVRIVGSTDCTVCKFYEGRGAYLKKWGTTYIESILCSHE